MLCLVSAVYFNHIPSMLAATKRDSIINRLFNSVVKWSGKLCGMVKSNKYKATTGHPYFTMSSPKVSIKVYIYYQVIHPPGVKFPS